MEWIIVTAADISRAVALGADRLSAALEDVEAETIRPPSAAWFGLRSVPATVRVRLRPAAPVQQRADAGSKGAASRSKRRSAKPSAARPARSSGSRSGSDATRNRH